MGKSISNREIVNRFLGNTENYKKVYAICRHVFGNKEDAEDAVHDIFLKLYNNAGTICFPENPDEALAYLQRVIQNARNDAYSRAKQYPEKGKDEEALQVQADENMSDLAKLEQVNEYVHEHCNLFTDDEVKLWSCIYENRSTKEKVMILGKTSNNLYVMRFNLFAKILKCMKNDELI